MAASLTSATKGPLTTGALFPTTDRNLIRDKICQAYNQELAQRGLTHLQIPEGVDAAIARPDLYLRVCEAVSSRFGTEVPIFPPLTTESYFYVLHELNVQHSDNCRGEVNDRYNQLVLRNNRSNYLIPGLGDIEQQQRILRHSLLHPLIPGRNLEQLGMDKCTSLDAKWYIKVFGDVVGGRDCFLRHPGLSAEESIMDRLGGNMDPIREALGHLSLRDLAVSKGVCRAWAEEVRLLQKRQACLPISGPIEAQFPSHQVLGPRFWEELKLEMSSHVTSVAHPGETVGGCLSRLGNGYLERADALQWENPVEAGRLRGIGAGYVLDCQASWTNAQVIDLYRMMGSVAREIKGERGCSIVLKPRDYHPDVHTDILEATQGSRRQRGISERPFHFAMQGHPLHTAPSSGPVTLSALSNTGLKGASGTLEGGPVVKHEGRISALRGEVPCYVDMLILIHFTEHTTGIAPYSNGPLSDTYTVIRERPRPDSRYSVGESVGEDGNTRDSFM